MTSFFIVDNISDVPLEGPFSNYADASVHVVNRNLDNSKYRIQMFRDENDLRELEKKYEEISHDLDELRCVIRLMDHTDAQVRYSARLCARSMANPKNENQESDG